MELRRESAANLLEKLLNCKLRLLGSIRKPAPGFVLTTDEEDVENPMNDTGVEVEREEGRPCKTNEHFINPPMFCFCSDSPSVMVKLRKDCLNTKEFVFAYGCAPYSIHNLCMDLIKTFPGVKIVLKQIVYMVKTLKSSHLLLQLFDKLCLEKFKKTYVLILYTKTRWGAVFFAAQRASKVKAACAALPGEILNADSTLTSATILRCCLLIQHTGEGDEATFSAVYACFLTIKYHIKTLDLSVMEALHLNYDDICEMIRLIHHRFSTIYSEAHALVFCTDPLFISMRRSMGFRFDEKFLHLGKGSINQQSKAVIARISMGNKILRRSMLSEFAVFVTRQQDTEDDFSDTSIKP
ncbi:hypothetical protein H310_11763 [Aphanomyces invadans]|uniref:Uncharacterized protein n=1 Tax=Aphanomyces invadans TaxID=157072 RepID=A0A024TJX8_9STRA|nr:hypothetical protein H310_11763 [Aphanomyces invadans]ETV94435.1 hypothetical protein H310_11763 [Aphanomyces invadans]|eukprot:XP_008876750.1 hypothetical protein H310_11763 [Aphanomyces invadans]